jgi:dTDP-4-dehydrorhamnose reductase
MAASTLEGRSGSQRVLVTGAGGQLGRYLRRTLNAAGHVVIGLGHGEGPDVDVAVDIRDRERVARAIDLARPDAIVHAAALTDVDGCERDPDLAHAINGRGSEHVAAAAAERGIWLIGVGTDFVFAGDGGAPYAEDATPNPISVYGASKLAGELAVLDASPDFAVARTAWVFGGQGKHFPRTVLAMLAKHGRMEVVDDEIGSPTFAGDLAKALAELLPHRPSGIFHLTNENETSRFGFARRVAVAAGVDPELVAPTSTEAFLANYPLPARRPAHSTLLNTRAAALGVRLPPWQDAVDRYVSTLAAELAAS